MTKFPVSLCAEKCPGDFALKCGEVSLTYVELERRILQTAGILRVEGLAEGMRVAIWMSPCWEYVVLMAACFRIGAVVVPISNRLPAESVKERLEAISCRYLVTREGESPGISEEFVRILMLEEFFERAPTDPLRMVTVDVDRTATIVFSSGSTGDPKAVVHTWGNHYFSALGANQNMSLQSGDAWLLSLPLYHVAGIAILFRCFLAGATVVLPSREDSLPAAIRSNGITHVSMVSTQLIRMLEANEPTPSLQAILLGGSVIPVWAIKQAVLRGWPIYNSYGTTESASQVTATQRGASLSELSTSGKVLGYREVRCRRDGEICIRGNILCEGYWQDGRLFKPFDEKGWYRTGDLGFFDVNGNLHVAGRKDNMFVSGGENIHPEEIERAIQAHPEVKRAIVVPITDSEFGYRPVAFVESRGQTIIEKEKWDRYLGKKLPGFKLPKAYLAWEELDIEEGMKVSRLQLAEIASAKVDSSSSL